MVIKNKAKLIRCHSKSYKSSSRTI